MRTLGKFWLTIRRQDRRESTVTIRYMLQNEDGPKQQCLIRHPRQYMYQRILRIR